MNNWPPLILSGSIAIDRIMSFDGSYQNLIHPDKIHSLSISVLINKLITAHGGTAANIAYNLALLGDSPVLIGSVGPDGQDYLSQLSSIGIDTNHVFISQKPTATFTVITDKENNQVGGFYPGAMADSIYNSLTPWLNAAPIVVISANDPATMNSQVEFCRQNNLTLVYDIGQQAANISSSELISGLQAATILFANEYEIELISAKTTFSISEIKNIVPYVITTLGDRGSVIEGNKVEQPIQVEAIPNLQVADPTGAGDAYRAGFLYGYRRQLNLETCARIGSVCASFAVKVNGTQNHTFTHDEIQVRLKYYKTEDVCLPITKSKI